MGEHVLTVPIRHVADELVRLQQAAEMVRDGTVASADGASINDRLTKATVETQKVA